jgi:hypothetical protein
MCKEPIDNVYLAKVTLVPDALNKHRLVAMVDYWTNLILSPFEEYIRTILSINFKHTDYMASHGSGSEKVMAHKGAAYCTDLSSFTDRFPADLQQFVVTKLLGGNSGQ